MKQIISQSKSNRRRRSQGQSIQAIKIMNFDPKIQSNQLPSKARYKSEQKIMRKRQIVKTFNSHIHRQIPNQPDTRRARSSNNTRIQNQLFGELHKSEILNQEINNLSQVFKEKISEIRSLVNRKSALSKRQNPKETQMIHFTEYVMHSEYPYSCSVLHSQNRRDCSFMKSVKARSIINKSADHRSRSQADQLFKSIQLNNSSKYAVSRRIMLSGQNINNSFREAKLRNQATYGSKFYLQQRKSRIRKSHKAVNLELSQEYKPWQIRFPDYIDIEGNLFHL